MTTTTPILLLALAGALLCAAPASAAPTTLDALKSDSPVDAAGSTVAWSRYDPATRDYRLVVRSGGVESTPAIAPSAVPFDADIGSDAAGRQAIVYSRCRSYRDGRGPKSGCDLYIVRVDGGAERKLDAASTATASQWNPTLDRGRLVYLAQHNARLPSVYERPLTAPASRRSKRLPGVPSRACATHSAQPGTCSRVSAGQIDDLELYGGRLAEIVYYATKDSSDGAQVRLVSLGSGSTRRIAFQGIGENNQGFDGLSFARGRVAWFRDCIDNPGCAGSGAYRYRVSNGDYERALEPRVYAGWAWTGGATYSSQYSPVDCRPFDPTHPTPCLVQQDGDRDWQPVRAAYVR